jgi:hypothetical protein
MLLRQLQRVFQVRDWPGGTWAKVQDYARIGFVIGAGVAVLASIQLLIRGPSYYVARFAVPYLVLVLLCLLGGVITCVILAILEQFAESFFSRVVVGFLTTLPVSLLFAMTLAKPDDSSGTVVFVAIAMSAIYGTMGAFLTWRH